MKPQPHKNESILQETLLVLEKKYKEVFQSKKNSGGGAQKSEIIDTYQFKANEQLTY